MEALVLLGGFAVFAVFGFFVMAKLDRKIGEETGDN